jgi:hypothetical protein
MRNTVYCIVENEPKANAILTSLRNEGFPAADISVILPGQLSDTKNISVKEDAIRGAETGGAVGGILGLVAGFAALTLPGIGALLVAGPLVSALGGAAVGGVVGGLAGGSGAVHPLGLPKEISDKVEGRLRAGDILVSVSSDEPDELIRAENIFTSSDADLVYHSEADKAA